MNELIKVLEGTKELFQRKIIDGKDLGGTLQRRVEALSKSIEILKRVDREKIEKVVKTWLAKDKMMEVSDLVNLLMTWLEKGE